MRSFSCLLLLPVLALACAKEPENGGIMLSMNTDLTVPSGVDVVGLYIVRIDGRKVTPILTSEVKAEYEGTDGKLHIVLPGTLAIASDGNPDSTIQVRIVAYNDQRVPVAMREARVRVPAQALKTLPMPLLWLNADDVVDANPGAGGPKPITPRSAGLGLLAAGSAEPDGVDAFGRFTSDFCVPDQTLDDTGACASIDIDPSSLEDWQLKDPRSGLTEDAFASDGSNRGPETGDAPVPIDHQFCKDGAERTCFDIDGCFSRRSDDVPNFLPVKILAEQIEGLGSTECFLPMDAVVDSPRDLVVSDVATAIAIGGDDGGVLAGDGRVIVFDERSGVVFDRDNRRVKLPPGVCRKAKKGSVLSVMVSPLCKGKKADEPICVYADGRAARSGCLDGSGWNGDVDPEPETPDAEIVVKCATIPNATGFWVDGETARVVASSGELFSFAASPLGDCMAGTVVPTAPTGLQKSRAYRLFGSSAVPGAVAIMGDLPGFEPTTAAVTFAASDPNVSLLPDGFFGAGAFFASNDYSTLGAGPVAVFLSGASPHELVFARVGGVVGTYTPPSMLPGLPAFNVASNLVATEPEGEPRTVSLAMHDGSFLHLVECAMPLQVNVSPNCTERTQNELPSATTPTAMAVTPFGRRYLLAQQDQIASLFAVVAGGPTDDPLELLRTLTIPSGLFPETTLAVADDGANVRAYFGTTQELVVVEFSPDASDYVERRAVELEPGHTARAVQITPGFLYWLDVDGSGVGTIRRRAVNDQGKIRD